MGVDVDLEYRQLAKQVEYLQIASDNYELQCTKLAAHVGTGHCLQMNETLQNNLNQIKAKDNYIRSFYSRKRVRGIWTYLGVMDTEDRHRVDDNMDKLRANEESLKTTITHQTNVVETLYKEVSRATEKVNSEMEKMQKWGELIVNKDGALENATIDMKKMIKYEQDLSEAGVWIIQMTQHIRQQMDIYIKILLKTKLHATEILELVDNNDLWSRLETDSHKLFPNLDFPRSALGFILPQILNVITIDAQFTVDKVLKVTLNFPIVTTFQFGTYVGTVSPAAHGTTISIVEMEKNVLLINPRDENGYLLTESELNACDMLGTTRLCNIQKPQLELHSSNECFPQMYYFNQTTSCQLKMIQTNRTIWLKTHDPNEWIYVAPKLVKARITEPEQVKYITLKGSGVVKLNRNSMITTSESTVLYYEQMKDNNKLNAKPMTLNFTEFSFEELTLSSIPMLPPTLLPFVSQEILLRHSTDIRDLKEAFPRLKNIVYAPLEHPWITTPMFLAALAMIFIGMLRCRPNINCCAKQEEPDHQPMNMTLLEMTPKQVNKANYQLLTQHQRSGAFSVL